MANTFSPVGFQPLRRVDGAAWTDAVQIGKIAQANSHKFFYGDPVVALSTGYIDRVAIGSIPTQGTLGVFLGCKYLSTARGATTWSPQFPGGDASADIEAYMLIDPMIVYNIWVGTGSSSAAGGPVTTANVYNNANWQIGTGNSTSGLSGAYLDFASVTTTNTLPLTIVGVTTDPPGVNGRDNTTTGNIAQVIFNQAALKVGTTGV